MEIRSASELLGYVGSFIGLLTVAQTMLHSLLPSPVLSIIATLLARFRNSLSRYHYVEIPEYDESCLPNELYSAIKLHLSANITSQTLSSKRIKLFRPSNASDFTWSPANKELVPICFQGVQLWWEHYTAHDHQQYHHNMLWNRTSMPNDEKRTYILKLHKKDIPTILAPYMEHILKQAKEIKHQNRERLLYTNGYRNDSYRHPWDSVPFKHPSTFDTLALDPEKKKKIKDDLLAFARGEEFYKKTGRAWKRGYLLYGPPGTGKSSLIAAMANLLGYDVYDLELTHVRSNGELRKLLLRTTSKSIIVIEDIDCSLELGNRGNIGKRHRERICDFGMTGESIKGVVMEDPFMQGSSTMTLSGLLNFTDGLWSCCGDERIFVFTTNHIESLDPALLRSGRMDMHILMSYCTFEAFKILAMNYLGVKGHPLFTKIEASIDEARITPAEVSEILIRNKDAPIASALEELLGELCGSTTKIGAKSSKGWPPITNSEKEMDSPPTPTILSCMQDVEQVKRAVQESALDGHVRDNHDAPNIKSNSIKCPNCKENLSTFISSSSSSSEEEELVEEDDGKQQPCLDKDMPFQLVAQKKLLQKAD